MRMEKKKRNRFLVVWLGLIVLTLVAVLAVGGGGESASIKETMRDAVLHGTNRISLFGLYPGYCCWRRCFCGCWSFPVSGWYRENCNWRWRNWWAFSITLRKAAAPTGIPSLARMYLRQACTSSQGRCLSCSVFRQ